MWGDYIQGITFHLDYVLLQIDLHALLTLETSFQLQIYAHIPTSWLKLWYKQNNFSY